MSAEKRPADDDPGASQMLVKRQNVSNSTGALARLNASGNALVQAVSFAMGIFGTVRVVWWWLTCVFSQSPRTSGLQAPVMELSGHTGEIFSAKFDLTGNLIASGSMDRSISACDEWNLDIEN